MISRGSPLLAESLTVFGLSLARVSLTRLLLLGLLFASGLVPGLPGALQAQSGTWEPVGPEGGSFPVVTVAPSDPDRVYAGTSSGSLFRSVDRGATWELRGRLPDAEGFGSLTVHPVESERLLATGQHVFVSDDGGRSWQRLEGPFGDRAEQVVEIPGISPPTPVGTPPEISVLLVLGKFGPSNLWRSADGGVTWEGELGPTGGAFQQILLDPQPPHALWGIFVGADIVDPRPFRSLDGGTTWTEQSEGIPPGGFARGLAVGGTASDRTFALSMDQNRLFVGRSPADPAGELMWEEPGGDALAELVEGDFAAEVAVQGTAPRLYLRLFPAETGEVERLLISADGGRTFEPVAGLPRDGLRTVAPFPDASDRALLGLDERGIWSLEGADGTAQPSTAGLRGSRISSLAFDPEPLGPDSLFAAGDLLWQSGNRGATWSVVERLPEASFVTALRGTPQPVGRAQDLLYAISGLQVARSQDGGQRWQLSSENALGICVAPEVLAAAPSAPDTLLVSGSFRSSNCGRLRECGLLKSTDGGQTFAEACGNLFGVVDQIVFDPVDPDIAYVAASGRPISTLDAATGRLFRTTDGGESWEPIREELSVAALAVSPRAPTVLWAGTREGEVWKSPDRGTTWERTPFPVPEIEPPPAVLSLTVDPLNPDSVYALLEGQELFGTRDAGASWEHVGQGLPASVSGALAVDPSNPHRLFAGTRGESVHRLLAVNTSPCQADATTLCLQGGRFEVKVAWQDFQGGAGVGQANPETADSGWFWFFNPDNVELLVKVLDGRTINDRFWVFFGALSNVEYAVAVRDTETGESRLYPNPAGRFASVGDTAAFPVPAAPATPASPAAPEAPGLSRASRRSKALPQVFDQPAPETCEPDLQTLCLQDRRFRVRVVWRDFQGGQGTGRAVPLTREVPSEAADDSGFFWFFQPDNLELVVKVIDGREVNGNFWFFYGALSNVEYEIEVTDVESGRRQVYTNPSGRFASMGDTETFDGSTFCGGIAGFPCPEGQVCDLEPGTCQVADSGGTCRVLPVVCPEVFEPVCGCDGRTYGNDCQRLRAGVTKGADGPCEG